jgi:glycosyltransferase involved in cell wall biosynthesis
MNESDTPKSPEVTVIIPTRNRRAWLEEAVESVVAQNGVSWELIVVDHRSSDGTPEYLSALEARGVLRISCTEGNERAAPANAGLAQARGKWTMFLDDDDVLLPDALARLAETLRGDARAVAAVGARWDWFCDDRSRGRRDSHPRFSCRREIAEELIFGWSAVSGQNLYRTDALRAIGGYRCGFWPCDDRDLWLRLAQLGPVRFLPDTVMKYRVHPGQFRPGDLEQIRERVFHQAIRKRPRGERRCLLKIRMAARNTTKAEVELGRGQFARALRSVAVAVRHAPRIFVSPLIGPWVLRRLARRVWHLFRGK